MKAIFFAGCLLLAGNAWCQQKSLNPDSLQAKLFIYAKTHSSGLLYVHTDKTLYTNNEPIWFSAYLLNSGLGKIADHTILSVSLMREDNRQVAFEQQHVMENGLSNGSLIVPDTIPPGNYLLNACTNVLDQHGKPVAIFSQPVTIKTILQRKFEAALSLVDTAVINGFVRAKVTVNIKDERRKGKPEVAYNMADNKPLHISLADPETSTIINIPAARLSEADQVLLTRVTYNYDTLYLSIKLPRVLSRGLNIRFFPEGGNLTDGLQSVVGLEAATTAGLPVSMSGILYGDEKPLDTVRTNGYGIGRFLLKPNKDTHYTFKVKANIYLNKDSLYTLPNILDNGIVMHFNEAVVKDTLHMTLYSKTLRKVQVVVHNYRDAFSLFNTEIAPAGKKLTLVVADLPKGIATVTVLDEQGRPLAERLFFAHYDRKINATIKTEKQVYNKRDSVAVKLTLKDKNGKPVQGLVSIAAVQDNRIESAKATDIESYVYLNHDLGNLPRDPQGRGFDNKEYLEDMFLTRGWRRYTWQSLMQGKVTDTLTMGLFPQFKGNVYNYGKQLKNPLDIVILRNAQFDKITTAIDGSFTLSREQIQVPEGKKVLLWLDKPVSYAIRIDNPFRKMDRQVAEAANITITGTARAVQSSDKQQINGMEKTTMLNAVTIKASKRDDSTFGYGRTNLCGDYVCEYNVLNCPIHTPTNGSKTRAPVKGDFVEDISMTRAGVRKVYQGCTVTGQEIPAVYMFCEFYGLKRDTESSSEPQFLSTLFWKPGIVTNDRGESSFSFFTSDVTGDFRIVVQGVGEKNMIFGENGFMVK